MEQSQISRRDFLKYSSVLAAAAALAAMTGCSPSAGGAIQADEAAKAITMVWLPDNSAADLTASREAIGACIKEASGCDVNLLTTTDYNVAIESIVSGNAQMALLGAEGYVQANKKNNAVQAAFTDSDENGTLDGACYYSRICVRKEDADEYRDGSGYSIKNVKGKTFSFVSATSTSGFKMPSSLIVDEFGLDSSDELIEGGAFFKEVLYGNSHAGSLVNLVNGDADAAAFDDVDVDMYLDLVEGEANSIGAVYKVKDGAEAPLDAYSGVEFVIIGCVPVLNAPFCFNNDALDEDTRKAIVAYFCSDAVADNPEIFVDPEDENANGIFEKASEKTCFLEVDDSWYDPIRKLG